jgi:hypothetical protein
MGFEGYMVIKMLIRLRFRCLWVFGSDKGVNARL